MKAETTRTVPPRAIIPLFFVHSTLRNFILCFHLPPLCFPIVIGHTSSSSCYLVETSGVLPQENTPWSVLYCSSATIADVDSRTFFHTSLLSLHFLLLTMFFRRRFFPLVLPERREHRVCRQ